MSVIIWLIPIALALGLAGLAAFLWSLRSGQYDDLEGAANRILLDDDDAADGSSGGDEPHRPAGEPPGADRR